MTPAKHLLHLKKEFGLSYNNIADMMHTITGDARITRRSVIRWLSESETQTPCPGYAPLVLGIALMYDRKLTYTRMLRVITTSMKHAAG